MREHGVEGLLRKRERIGTGDRKRKVRYSVFPTKALGEFDNIGLHIYAHGLP
jgi:hypothetical protein